MASTCEICGKTRVVGNNVSHSHRRTKRWFKPNIQAVRGVFQGKRGRFNVCTSCLKAGKIEK